MQLITGFVSSAEAFTIKLQDDWFPEASVAVKVTVIPDVKMLPAAGFCVIIGVPPQLSVAETKFL